MKLPISPPSEEKPTRREETVIFKVGDEIRGLGLELALVRSIIVKRFFFEF
ncbi:hypothetical protein CsatA_003026 [Cannabis sativa]